jgi:formate dehydrogenase/NADH-quinone oxidoreductase subunit F
MLGSGALVVLAEGTDLLAASTNVLRFFRNESCGKCVPCRVGSTKAHELVESRSALDDDECARILQLEEAMRKTSICGLGQVALGPVVSVLGLQRAERPPSAGDRRAAPKTPATWGVTGRR